MQTDFKINQLYLDNHATS